MKDQKVMIDTGDMKTLFRVAFLVDVQIVTL